MKSPALVLTLANGTIKFLDPRVPRSAGGPGSGNFGHAGRPGEVGGSSSSTVVLKEPLSLYHSSTNPSIPSHDDYFGGAEFEKTFGQNEFGPYRSEAVLPRGTKILDLNKDSREARDFKVEIVKHAWPSDTEYHSQVRAGNDGNDFYEAWTDKNNIIAALKTKPDTVVKYQDEYLIPKEILMRIKVQRVLGGPGSGNFGHAGRPGEVGGSATTAAGFVNEIEANLAATSRTSKGEESPLAGKPGLTIKGQALANQVEVNTRNAAEYVWLHRHDDINTPEEAHHLIDAIGSRINNGLLNGPLYRQHETGRNTSVEDLHKELSQFERQFTDRLDSKDPVAVAAWVEKEFDVRIHPFSDGVGRSAKLLSAFVLARAGHPLPVYGDRTEYYKAAKKSLSEFTNYYRGLFKKDRALGGPGSGNFGHVGRPGEVGGSGPGGATLDQETFNSRIKALGFKIRSFDEIPAEIRQGLNARAVTKPLPISALNGIEAGLADLKQRSPGLYQAMQKDVALAYLDHDPPSAAATTATGFGTATIVINGAQALDAADDLESNTIPGKMTAGKTGDAAMEALYKGVIIHESGHVADGMRNKAFSRAIPIELSLPDETHEEFNKKIDRIANTFSKYGVWGGPAEMAAELFTAVVEKLPYPKELKETAKAMELALNRK